MKITIEKEVSEQTIAMFAMVAGDESITPEKIRALDGQTIKFPNGLDNPEVDMLFATVVVLSITEDEDLKELK